MSATQEKIQELAYHLWQEAGSPHGQDWDFWLKAETQLGQPAIKPKAAAKPKAEKATPAKAKAAPKPKAPAKPKTTAAKA